MTEPPRTRKRVQDEAEAPEAVSARRGCMLIGAFLGVGVGVLVALFVVPPLFDRYFGVADIELGKTYRGDAVELRVERQERVPALPGQATDTYEVVLQARAKDGSWCPEVADFRLDFRSGLRIGAAAPLTAPAGCPPPGDHPITVRFPLPRDLAEEPELVNIDEPRVRMHLLPGDPRDR